MVRVLWHISSSDMMGKGNAESEIEGFVWLCERRSCGMGDDFQLHRNSKLMFAMEKSG